jgi:hypothetical protein
MMVVLTSPSDYGIMIGWCEVICKFYLLVLTLIRNHHRDLSNYDMQMGVLALWFKAH